MAALWREACTNEQRDRREADDVGKGLEPQHVILGTRLNVLVHAGFCLKEGHAMPTPAELIFCENRARAHVRACMRNRQYSKRDSRHSFT